MYPYIQNYIFFIRKFCGPNSLQLDYFYVKKIYKQKLSIESLFKIPTGKWCIFSDQQPDNTLLVLVRMFVYNRQLNAISNGDDISAHRQHQQQRFRHTINQSVNKLTKQASTTTTHRLIFTFCFHTVVFNRASVIKLEISAIVLSVSHFICECISESRVNFRKFPQIQFISIQSLLADGRNCF